MGFCNVATLDLGDGRQIKVGFDSMDNCVSLALNHFEDSERWGAQALTSEEARQLSDLLFCYSNIVDRHR